MKVRPKVCSTQEGRYRIETPSLQEHRNSVAVIPQPPDQEYKISGYKLILDQCKLSYNNAVLGHHYTHSLSSHEEMPDPD
jgi:hypothetical protein